MSVSTASATTSGGKDLCDDDDDDDDDGRDDATTRGAVTLYIVEGERGQPNENWNISTVHAVSHKKLHNIAAKLC